MQFSWYQSEHAVHCQAMDVGSEWHISKIRFCSTLLCIIRTSALLYAPHCDSIGSLPNGSLHILVPSCWVLVSLSFRRCNDVSDSFIQYLVFSFACFLAHFAFLIDFVRRNDDFTFIYSSRARPFPPFLMAGTGGLIRQGGTNSPSATLPFLARGN